MKRCKDCRRPINARSAYVKRIVSGVPRFYSRCKPCYNSWTWSSFGKGYVKGPGRMKREARDQIRSRVRFGKISKPGVCGSCNLPTPREKLEAHHEDHAKPLVVSWLCRPCHREKDALLKSG